MKKLLTLLLLCAVLSLAAPVSAGDYLFFKNVNATTFTNALIDYCNGNEVHEMTEYEFELNGHDFETHDVMRTDESLEFGFRCTMEYWAILPLRYRFSGVIHVDNPQDGLKKPFTLTITDKDSKFTATGENWKLQVWNICCTRFKV